MLLSQLNNLNNNLIHKYRYNSLKQQNIAKPLNVSSVSFGYKKDDKPYFGPNYQEITKYNPHGSVNTHFISGFQSDPKLVKLPSYVASSVKEYEVTMVNISRRFVLNTWFSELEKISSGAKISKLHEEFKDKPDMKLFILSSLTSSLQSSNRIIPSPFDENALATTIKDCLQYDNDRKVSQSRFMKEYNNTLVEQTLDEIISSKSDDDLCLYTKDGKPIDKSKLSSSKDLSSVWVKISRAKNNIPSYEQVSIVEKLSNPNWCTRCRINKANKVLIDGPFYIYLERNNSGQWDSKAAITTFNGKISQIQGKRNDNFIPMQMRETITKFLTEIGAVSSTPQMYVRKNRRCEVGYDSELPYAYTQLLIGQKLAEVTKRADGVRTTSLNTALKNRDSFSILKLLYPNSEVKMLDNGKLVISSYKTNVHIDTKTSVVPISLIGINEDELLSDVESVKLDLDLVGSQIEEFPSSLKYVGGKLILSKEQFEKFKKIIYENYDYQMITKMNRKMQEIVVICGLTSIE